MIKFKSLKSDVKFWNKEGNALKRYNSRLVFNSFISEITDVPKHDANSQVRMKKIYRDFSNGSMKNLWYNMLPEQKSGTISSGFNKTDAVNKGENTPLINLSYNIEVNPDSESKITQNSGEK